MRTGLALLVGLLVGAAIIAVPTRADARRKKETPVREFAPSLAAPIYTPPADGAIFHAASGYAPLTSGARASHVGDVLTILLVERTQASKSNTASTDRSGSVSITPPPTGPLDFIKSTDLSVSGGGKFDGKGAAAQSNQLSGEISVTIAEVYQNGTMLVRGEKQLTLNRGDEQIHISGIVRPTDVDPDNRVLSTRVADARISYSGTGEIARASRQGWLNHFFSVLSPF